MDPTSGLAHFVAECRWQDLPEQVFQKKLAQSSSELGRAQDFLQRCDVLANFVNFPIGLFETAEAPLHRSDDASRAVEPLAQILLCLAKHVGVFSQSLLHLPE